MNQEKIGKFIAELRKEQNMTQEEFAEKLGVTNKSVSRWENGKTLPDLSMITILAKEFHVDISEILNGRKMSTDELIELRNTIDQIILYSDTVQKKKKEKVNIYFAIAFICSAILLIDNQFHILSYIFKYDIPEFINGLLTGFTLIFYFIAFYNNNHDITLKQKKRNLFKQKN